MFLNSCQHGTHASFIVVFQLIVKTCLLCVMAPVSRLDDEGSTSTRQAVKRHTAAQQVNGSGWQGVCRCSRKAQEEALYNLRPKDKNELHEEETGGVVSAEGSVVHSMGKTKLSEYTVFGGHNVRVIQNDGSLDSVVY